MSKPENRIFVYAIEHIQCDPQECILVDNSVRNLNAAQQVGINIVLFNRDNDAFTFPSACRPSCSGSGRSLSSTLRYG